MVNYYKLRIYKMVLVLKNKDGQQVDIGALQKKDEPSQKPSMSQKEFAINVARAIGQGLTFGFADEAEAFARSILGENYETAVASARGGLQQLREERPEIAYPTEIGASMIMPFGLAGAIPRVGSALKTAYQTKPYTTGAATGYTYGLGTAEGEGFERLPEAVTGGAIGVGATALSPRVSEVASKLIPEGVKTTVGQTFEGALGQLARGGEDVLERLPFFGGAVSSMRERALKTFDVAAVNKALEPAKDLGVKPLPITLQPREAVSKAYEQLGNAYSKTLSKISLPSGAELNSFVTKRIRDNGKGFGLSDEEIKTAINQVTNILNQRTRNGTISGDDFKQAQMQLRDLAGEYLDSADVQARNIGRTLSSASDAFFDSLSNINPKAVKEIKSIDSAYSRFKPLQYLVGIKSKSLEGTFTPSQLLQEITSGGRKQRGIQAAVDVERPLQEMALEAQSILPSQIKGSDTAAKQAVISAMGAGGVEYATELPAYITAGLLAPSAIYNPYSQTLLKGAMRGMGRAGRSPAVSGLLAEPVLEKADPLLSTITIRPEGSQYLATD